MTTTSDSTDYVPEDPLEAHPGFRQELRVGRIEVCDFAIKFERLRRKLPLGWLVTIGWLLIGAGGGAYIQDGKWNTGSAVAFVSGVALVVGIFFAYEERSENLNNLCDDFLRFVDKWNAMDGYKANSEYVLEVVHRDTRGRLVQFSRRVRRLKRQT